MKSIEYSWKYVTADELLSHGRCEFLYAKLTPKTEAGYAILYDGENTLGKKIIKLHTGGLYNQECSPPVPVYCRRGLYIDVTTDDDALSVDGVLVIWRELGHGKREGS